MNALAELHIVDPARRAATLRAASRGPLTDWEQGYRDQTTWLETQNLPLDHAEHSLTQRLASTARGDYNNGGTAATRDYIARLTTAAARSADTEGA